MWQSDEESRCRGSSGVTTVELDVRGAQIFLLTYCLTLLYNSQPTQLPTSPPNAQAPDYAILAAHIAMTLQTLHTRQANVALTVDALCNGS
jgi:hypothetical protein